MLVATHRAAMAAASPSMQPEDLTVADCIAPAPLINAGQQPQHLIKPGSGSVCVLWRGLWGK